MFIYFGDSLIILYSPFIASGVLRRTLSSWLLSLKSWAYRKRQAQFPPEMMFLTELLYFGLRAHTMRPMVARARQGLQPSRGGTYGVCCESWCIKINYPLRGLYCSNPFAKYLYFELASSILCRVLLYFGRSWCFFCGEHSSLAIPRDPRGKVISSMGFPSK